MTHEEIVDSCIDKFVRNAHERDCVPKLRSELKEALTTYRTQVLEDERTRIAELIDGYKVDDGVSFEGDLPPAEIFAEMLDDTNMIREHVNGILDVVIEDIKHPIN